MICLLHSVSVPRLAAMRRSRPPCRGHSRRSHNSPIRIGSDEPVATENCQLFWHDCTTARTTARTSTRMLPRLAGLPTATRSGQARILHAVIPILQGKASARAPFHLSINQTRPQDSISALSSSFFQCAMSSSQGLQYTSSALSAHFLWCGSSCSQGFQVGAQITPGQDNKSQFYIISDK